jgi:type I restriction enzyme S subunit
MLTFQRGFDITKKEQEDGSYPVISSSGPNSTHSAFKVKGPGVVIGRKGTLGTVFYAENDFWPHDTTLWVKDFHGNEPKFSYYFLRTLGLEQYDCGASNPTLNRNHIHTLPIRRPPIEVQCRIACILSAYDDLIENNTRRIQILEQMAQMLYREWFVNFRFPGHEKVKMVESEIGLIPEGWSAQSVGKVSLNFDSKRKPLSSIERSTRKGPYPYYGAAKIFDFIDDFIFDGVFLLVGEDGSVITPDNKPVLQLTDGKFWPNNHTHVIQGKAPISAYYLYLRLADADVTGCVTGAAQPKITQANLNRIPVAAPTAQLLERFDATTTPMFLDIALLQKKNRNLRTTRDLLLPKLLSGEVSFETLEEEVLAETV